MIYDYTLSTGDSTISGCVSERLGTDRTERLNLRLLNAGGHCYYDTNLITGEMSIMAALNGQTLFEQPPTTGQGPNGIFYQIFTGDFFIKTGAIDLIERSKIFFTPLAPKRDTYRIFYNKITGGSFVGTGMGSADEMGRSLRSGISGGYPSAVFGDFDFFINGQKLYSGLGVQEAPYGDSWMPDFVNGQGFVTADNAASFKATAYLKTDRINEVTGVSPDVFGSPFIEGQTNLYVNGAREEPSSYLELYSGVNTIKSGASAVISAFKANTINKSIQL